MAGLCGAPATAADLVSPVRRDDLAFTAAEGGQLRLSVWRKREFLPVVSRLAEEPAGPSGRPFPPVTPHDLRHTAASLAVASGANVKVLQRMLGHSSAAFTLDVYADLFDSGLDEVSEAMTARISPERLGWDAL